MLIIDNQKYLTKGRVIEEYLLENIFTSDDRGIGCV